jgi:hypothetical protein
VEGLIAEERLECAKYRRQLEAKPEHKTRTGPIKNPSNVVPPLAMIHGQGMGAQINSHFSMRKPFWTCKALRDEPEDHADAKLWTKYVGSILAESRNDLNIAEVRRVVSAEAAVMPVVFVKVPWSTLEWNFKTKEEDGAIRSVRTTYRDGPEPIVVPIEHCLYPPEWSKVHQMPWITHEVTMPKHELEAKKSAWRDVEKVLGWARDHSTVDEASRDEAIGKRGERKGVYDISETHFYRDVDKDGLPEDLILTWHRPSKTLLNLTYNVLGVREFVPFGYIRRSYSIESRGTGQICVTLQEEAEGIHNVRNDNMKIVNVRMLAMRRSVLLANKEEIYGGKIWITDNPKEDIVPVQLGEVYPSSLEAENWTWAMAAKATGFEAMQGMPNEQLGSRDTWRGQAFRAGKQGSIFASIVEDMEERWSEVALLVVYNLIRNKGRVISNELTAGRLTPEEIERLRKMLAIDISEVPQKFAFSVRTTDLDKTYEALKEGVMTVMGLQVQYMQMAAPYAMQLFGPAGQQMLQQAPELYSFMLKNLTGLTRLVESTYKFFNIEDTENYLPDVRVMEMRLEMIKAMQQAMMGGAGGGAGARQVGGGPGAPQGPEGLAGAAGAGEGGPSESGSAGGTEPAGAGATQPTAAFVPGGSAG